jgi:hypothetical protein
MGKKAEDLTGRIFGLLHVVKRGEDYFLNGKKHSTQWICWCECEKDLPFEERNLILIPRNDLIRKRKISCGCHKEAIRKEKLANKLRLKEEKINQYKERIKTKYDLTSQDYGIGITSGGYEFWFDKEDYDLIKPYHWWKGVKGEVITKTNDGKTLLLHRLVMGVDDFQMQVDHIRHKRYDNRKSELRIIDNSKNQMNSVIKKNNTSGCKGVSWDKRAGKWYAYINVNKKRINLGKYINFEDAVKVRKGAEEKYFGEYSYDNSMRATNG